MATPDRFTRREALARLWAHESLRVFHDRLINAEDKDTLRKLLAAAAAAHLPNLLQPDELSGTKPLLFGDFHTAGAATEEREYEEVRRELHPVTTPQKLAVMQIVGIRKPADESNAPQSISPAGTCAFTYNVHGPDTRCGAAVQGAEGAAEGIQCHAAQAAGAGLLCRRGGTRVPHCPSLAAAAWVSPRATLPDVVVACSFELGRS